MTSCECSERKQKYAAQPAERYKQMIAAEKIIMDDALLAPIYQASPKETVAENVDGFEVLPFGRTINLRQASVKIIIKIRTRRIRVSFRLKSKCNI